MILRLKEGGPWQLICLPFAGGAAHMYRPLAEAMPPRWEVIAVSPPGRGGVPGPAARDFEEFAAAQEAAVLTSARPPYVLFGHSLGGWVAYRIACRLAGSSVSPSALALSGCLPPGSPDSGVPMSSASDDDLTDFLGRSGGLVRQLLADPEFLAYSLPLLRSDLKIRETFVLRNRSTLTIPGVLLAGSCDSIAPRAGMGGWQALVPRASIHEIEGGHMFVVTAATATAGALRALAGGSSHLCRSVSH